MIGWNRLHRKHASNEGFTLIELAIVMLIAAFLVGGIIAPLTTQRDKANRQSTTDILEQTREALIGFALIQTPPRLPCPATATSNGQEAPVGGGNCTTAHGFVPARTLGLIGPTDTNGLLLDAWNRPIRYSITTINTFEYATNITLNAALPNFSVCRDPTCGGAVIADAVVAVLLSQGNNIATSAAQNENTDSDNIFVEAPMSDLASNAFDDLLLWISPFTLSAQLAKAGKYN